MKCWLYPDVAGKFLEILSHEIRKKDGYLLQLAYQSVRKRISEAIYVYTNNTKME
jgi:hypothetical protein